LAVSAHFSIYTFGGNVWYYSLRTVLKLNSPRNEMRGKKAVLCSSISVFSK
jgi:hypothetical protein